MYPLTQKSTSTNHQYYIYRDELLALERSNSTLLSENESLKSEVVSLHCLLASSTVTTEEGKVVQLPTTTVTPVKQYLTTETHPTDVLSDNEYYDTMTEEISKEKENVYIEGPSPTSPLPLTIHDIRTTTIDAISSLKNSNYVLTPIDSNNRNTHLNESMLTKSRNNYYWNLEKETLVNKCEELEHQLVNCIIGVRHDDDDAYNDRMNNIGISKKSKHHVKDNRCKDNLANCNHQYQSNKNPTEDSRISTSHLMLSSTSGHNNKELDSHNITTDSGPFYNSVMTRQDAAPREIITYDDKEEYKSKLEAALVSTRSQLVYKNEAIKKLECKLEELRKFTREQGSEIKLLTNRHRVLERTYENNTEQASAKYNALHHDVTILQQVNKNLKDRNRALVENVEKLESVLEIQHIEYNNVKDIALHNEQVAADAVYLLRSQVGELQDTIRVLVPELERTPDRKGVHDITEDALTPHQ